MTTTDALSQDILSVSDAAALCRELRADAGVSQAHLADTLGLSQPAVSHAESGSSRYRWALARILSHYTGADWTGADCLMRV